MSKPSVTGAGPQLESLTRRLAECPSEFLAEPRISRTGQVHVTAVVSDTIAALGGEPLTPDQAAAFQPKAAKEQRNRLSTVLITCWLLNDPWFAGQKVLAQAAYDMLAAGLTEIAAHVRAPQFTSDPDRREELARLVLTRLDLRPAGETEAQAHDRLATLNTAERLRVIEAARASEARAQAIRQAMAQKAAEEAADKWTRE